ncbi:hypothetical protein WAF17_13240 [Bernardetia sp. ABR2-2B]|uniref:hypothetical protein n=1 Tax=Bernardetia sp. ABR2-2B TaxID=3127472 RepID=UPI0030D59905
MNVFIKNIVSSLLILLSLTIISSSLQAQNKRSKNMLVGYMGKRVLLNAYLNTNIIPISTSYLPYNHIEGGFLSSVKLPVAWSLEGEYLLTRRFGVTLGSTSFRASVYDPFNGESITKLNTRTTYIGIKNYLKREGGLAPVGFYQQLRLQRLMVEQERFRNTSDGYVSQENKSSMKPSMMLGYGVGFNFGIGKIPLFTVGADINAPLSSSDLIQEGFAMVSYTVRLGVVVPLF